MNYNKSIFKKPSQSSKKVFEKKYTIQINTVDFNKRKSEENFKDKINQIPFLHRMSIQNKNMKIPSFIQHKNASHLEKPLQDQKYYLHILNNIYLNDSHLTNKNIIRNSFKGSSNTSKKFEKKKTFNYIKRGSKDSCQKKNASKKNSYCSKDIKFDNNFRKKSNISNINEVKNNSNKNLLRIKESKTEARNNKSKKDILLRYRSSKTLSKFSNNNDNIINISKNKSSKDLRKHNDDENMIIEEKNEKDIKKKDKDKEVKKVKNKKKKKNKSVYKVNKQESELINSETKNNSNKNNSKNIEIIENEINKDLKKYKSKNIAKKLKFCLFCCFNTKEDSL